MPEIDPHIRLNARCLSEVFGISPSRLAQYHREGMPKAARGLFDLAECVQWNVARWQTKSGNDKSLDEQRQALLLEQTIKTNLENQVTQGKLFDSEELEAALVAILAQFKGQLESLAPRVCNRLAGMHDANEIKAEIYEETRAILDAVSDAFTAMGGDIQAGRESTKAAPAKSRQRVGRPRKNTAPRKPRAGKVAK
jgi:phage terminase Nu1 subunit (DNA packaging protein)